MEGLSKIFASNLQFLRKKNKLTQKDFAEILNYSEKTIAKWESGTTMPSVEAIVNIANTLGVDVNTLLYAKHNIYFLGIDAGGTKTQLRLCDENGNIVKEIIEKGSNPFDIGIENSKEILKKAIKEVCWNVPYSSVSMFAGIAGGGAENNKKIYNEFFKSFNFACYGNGGDSENVVAAGLGDTDGITLILGTGVCLFKVVNNEFKVFTGWGYLFDEGGSAFNFGQDAFKAYFAEIDGYGKKTLISDMIVKRTNLRERELLDSLYSGGKKYIASFAPIVFECAHKYNDEIAKGIISKNMTHVANLLKSVSKTFDSSVSKIPVVITGGLTKQEKLVDYIYDALGDESNLDIRVLTELPVVGAVIKAKKLWNNFNKEK